MTAKGESLSLRARRTVATVVLVAVGLPACGAWDADAPAGPAPPACVPMDLRLGPMLEQVGQGKTQHLAQLLSTRLDDQGQRALVQLLLDIAAALPGGTAEQLPTLLSSSGLGALIPLVVALLAPLPGQPSATPPQPARTAELQALSAVAQACLTPALFNLGERVLRDPKTAAAVQTLLAAGPSGAQQILAAVQASGPDGRKAFQVLLRNVLTSAAAPAFDPAPLLTTVDGLVDPQAPGAIGALRDVLYVALAAGSAQDRATARQAVQAFAACALHNDPDQRIAGYLFDVLATAPPSAQALEVPKLDVGQWLPLLAAATGVLATQPAASDAWSQLLGLILRPDVAIAALPELLALLQSDALPGVVGLLADLLAQPCRTSAGAT